MYVSDDVGGASGLQAAGDPMRRDRQQPQQCTKAVHSATLAPAAGAGLGRLDAAIIFEELAWGCVPTAAYLSIHNMVAKGGCCAAPCCSVMKYRLPGGQPKDGRRVGCTTGMAGWLVVELVWWLLRQARLLVTITGCGHRGHALLPCWPSPMGASCSHPVRALCRCRAAIDQYGSAHQRGIYLPAMCTMDLIASYCLTEPASGSDAAALKTTARRVNDHFVLTGTKAFIRCVQRVLAGRVRTASAGWQVAWTACAGWEGAWTACAGWEGAWTACAGWQGSRPGCGGNKRRREGLSQPAVAWNRQPMLAPWIPPLPAAAAASATFTW